MTYEEAIIKLKTDSCVGCPKGWDSPINCRCEDCEVKIATVIAIEALEKQSQRKPHVKVINRSHSSYCCPKCGATQISKFGCDWCAGKRSPFCSECGQALDWSDTE